MSTLPTEEELTRALITNGQMKARLSSIRNYLADLLGTDSGDKAAARAALGVVSSNDDETICGAKILAGNVDFKQDVVIDGSASIGTNLAVNSINSNGDANSVLNVTGSIVASGNVSAYSDKELKENEAPITDAIRKVEALNGITFNYKASPDIRYAGLIAQDVQEVLPEVVSIYEGRLTVAYGNMVGLLVEAIKEQQAQINELRAKIESVR